MRSEPSISLEPAEEFRGWSALADVEKEFTAQAIARACEEMATQLGQFAKVLHHPEIDVSPADEQSLLKCIIAEDELRASHFDHHLGEADWRSLTYLYLAELEQRRVRISEIGIGAGVPATTALRHITGLVRHGLVSCDPHPLDRRVKFVRLTDAARRGFSEYLKKVSALRGCSR